MKPQEIVVRIVVEGPAETAAPTPEPTEDFVEVKGKEYTKSQLMRFALRDLWLNKEKEKTFDQYYEEQMDRFITAVRKQVK